MIMLKTKIIYHQCVIDEGNTMKQLFIFSTTVGIEKKIWNIFEPIIKKLNPNSENNFMQNILGLNAINTENKSRKLMTINTSILNEIWKARNLFKHEQKKIPTDNIIQNRKRSLKEIITIQFNKHEKNNTILSFKKYSRLKTLYVPFKIIL